MSKIVRFAAAAAATTAIAIAPMSAVSADEMTLPYGGSLQLSVVQSGPESQSTVTLNCNPNGGNHPQVEQACDQLTNHSGQVAEIGAGDAMCMMKYEPVTVRAKGIWRGETLNYTDTFSNRCVAVRDTGGVLFDF